MTTYRLEYIAFLVGGAIMTLEVVGSRILAPYLGTSLVVWTGLIGIVLFSLSLGYFFGGKLADRRPSYNILAGLILLASLFIAITGTLKEPILRIIQSNAPDIRIAVILANLILFAPASALLGAVSPYTVKLKLHDINSSGKTAGSLYAVGTIGSIAGTFFTGFWLIPLLGNTNILFGLSTLLALTAALAAWKSSNKGVFVSIVVAIIYTMWSQLATTKTLAQTNTLLDIDTPYNRAWVIEATNPLNKQVIRYLQVDQTIQSGAFRDNPSKLLFDYTAFYRLANHFNPNIKNSLMIGGGAYSFPKAYLEELPDASMDVVEIDPGLTKIAEEYFGLKPSPRLNIYHEDGRTFLAKNRKEYDAILLDIFHGYVPPYHLATKETIQRLKDSLSKDGVVLVNIASSIEGNSGKFLRAEYRTFKDVFPQVYLFPVSYVENDSLIQNVMLVALKTSAPPSLVSSNPELQKYLTHLWRKPVSNDLPTLTDDYAPVDYYVTQSNISSYYLGGKNQ